MNESTLSTLLGMAGSTILGGLSWLIVRFIGRVEALEGRMAKVEEVVKAMARHRLSPSEMARLYSDDYPGGQSDL